MKTLTRGTYLGSQTDTLSYRNIIISKTEYQQREDQSWHYHENSFFAYFLKGSNKELRKSGEIKCSAGTLLFYKPEEIHRNQDYAFGTKIIHLEIDKSWFADNSVKPENIKHSEINNLFAKNVFINIINEFSIKDELSEPSIQSLTLCLFNLLARHSEATKKNPSWKYNFDKIVDEQITNKPSLVSIAKKLNVHPVTLSKQFPKHFNCTFREFMQQRQIAKAVQMLANKNISVSTISEHCGFSDTSNFIRCFKRMSSITPDAYRKLL